MTGIERLRELIDENGPGRYITVPMVDGTYQGGYIAATRNICDKLCIIYDQIKSDIDNERDRWDNELCEAQMDKARVMAVYLEMNRHVLGHEGMEDSPVARWARELRDALKSDTSEVGDTQTPSWHDPAEDADVTSEAPKVTRDPAEDVSMSAYDLLPADERDAIAWVREHGGLDYVRTEWRSRVPYDRYERRRQRLLGHIAECETALGRRREIISELTHRVSDLTRENAELRRRAMPEGIEWLIEAWPRFEDNAPVKLGDMALIDGDVDMVEAVQIWIHGKPVIYGDNGSQQLEKGERVRLPVLAADGEPLEAGQTVWDTNGDELVIGAFEDGGHTVTCRYADVGDAIPVHGMWSPSDLTHQRPVLDADGVEIRAGDTVWHVETGEQCKVVEVDSRSVSVDFRVDGDGTKHTGSILPANLTHRASVLAADGEPLEAGQTVWDVRGIRQFRVLSITSDGEHGEYTVETVGVDRMGLSGWSKPSDLTHQRPVLDADGVPIREGDEVHAIWNFTGHSYVVEDASNPLEIAVRAKEYPDQRTTLRAKNLTHAKPAIDSWERIEEDATLSPEVYCHRNGIDISQKDGTEIFLADTVEPMARDLVRRAKTLAEKENRNE